MSIRTSQQVPQGTDVQTVADEAERGSGGRVQLKHQLAGLSYDEQVQLLRPPSPIRPAAPKADGKAGEAVQRASAGQSETAQVHQAAAEGFSGSSQSLPHLGTIQKAFGGHDVSGIQAHVDGKAARAATSMGALAYASGERVAFKKAPDLHTAAHEAAHVVQQRSGVSLPGGVGQTGDAYEQHADAVADRVVAGDSVEHLLSEGAAGGTSTGVQRKSVQRLAPVQMAGPTAETPTATDVPRVGETPPQLAWRRVENRGTVAWYVVKVEPGQDASDPAVGVHPDEAFSMAANPANEAAADAFEQAVGNHAMGSGEAKGAAKALADKAVAVTEAYLAAMTEAGATQAELDTTFQDMLGGMGPTWAGSAAVPIPADATNKAELAKANVERIKAVAASGNVREMVNLGVSFMYKFGDVNAAQTRVINMQTFYNEAKAKVGTVKPGVADFTATLAQRIKDKQWVTPVNDNATVSGQQNTSRTKNPAPPASTQSTRQVGSLGEYAQLSENEKLVMFGSEASKEKDLKSQVLTWSEGRKVWFMNEGDKFVQDCRDASIPMGGGVSGTTMRIMELAQVFNTGASPVDMRAAAIGYLIPIRAHTLIEVMKGAMPYGAGDVPSPPTFAIYANIAPWGDLTSLGNETLKKLVAQTQKKGG